MDIHESGFKLKHVLNICFLLEVKITDLHASLLETTLKVLYCM